MKDQRTTFNITPSRELYSALGYEHEAHALKVGMAITLAQPFETGKGIVPAGAKGFIELVDNYDGTTWILMEGIEPALYHWDNRLVLIPFDCEDLLACIKLQTKLPISLPVDNRTPLAQEFHVEVPEYEPSY